MRPTEILELIEFLRDRERDAESQTNHRDPWVRGFHDGRKQMAKLIADKIEEKFNRDQDAEYAAFLSERHRGDDHPSLTAAERNAGATI